jgi:hypothetical protein
MAKKKKDKEYFYAGEAITLNRQSTDLFCGVWKSPEDPKDVIQEIMNYESGSRNSLPVVLTAFNKL